MILQRKEIEECISSYKKTKFSEVMTADYYDDTKNLKLFIQIFNFFDCSKHVQLQLQTGYFDSVKRILKLMQCRI